MSDLEKLPEEPGLPAIGSLTRRLNRRLQMWGALRCNRVALINRAVAAFGPDSARYLEIGCQDNQCFDAIIATDKTGVDPASGGPTA